MSIVRDAPGKSKSGPGFAPSEVVVQRSFILMGLGALIGLIVAGYALFTAKGTSTLMVPAEDVALVNQQKRLLS